MGSSVFLGLNLTKSDHVEPQQLTTDLTLFVYFKSTLTGCWACIITWQGAGRVLLPFVSPDTLKNSNKNIHTIIDNLPEP